VSAAGNSESVRSASELPAVIGYLQRAEVRLSTLHRVAGSFLSGAALLVILPVVLKDIVLALFLVTAGLPTDRLVVALQLVALAAIAAAPLYALYSLFRDLVEFYFTDDYPGAQFSGFYPRFILSGITLTREDAPLTKELVLKEEMSALDFVVPGGAAERKNLLRVYEYLKGSAEDAGVPEEARVVPSDRMALVNSAKDQLGRERRLAYWTAFALAGSVDRSLPGEVAKTEASLVRHASLLRRLVLRYAKAVLTLIWATVVFLALTFGQSLVGRGVQPQPTLVEWEFLAMVGLPLLWSLAAGFVARRPVDWISTRGRGREYDPSDAAHDRHLVRFEIVVFVASLVVLVCEAWTLALASLGTGIALPHLGSASYFVWALCAAAAVLVARQGWRHGKYLLQP
jgi:hypothetical protein